MLNVALTEIDQLLQLSPTFTNRRLRVILLGRRATAWHDAGNLVEAVEVHRQVIAAAEQLLLEQPDDLQAMQDLAFAWDKLSVTRVGLGQLEEALAALEKACHYVFNCSPLPRTVSAERNASLTIMSRSPRFLRNWNATKRLWIGW